MLRNRRCAILATKSVTNLVLLGSTGPQKTTLFFFSTSSVRQLEAPSRTVRGASPAGRSPWDCAPAHPPLVAAQRRCRADCRARKRPLGVRGARWILPPPLLTRVVVVGRERHSANAAPSRSRPPTPRHAASSRSRPHLTVHPKLPCHSTAARPPPPPTAPPGATIPQLLSSTMVSLRTVVLALALAVGAQAGAPSATVNLKVRAHADPPAGAPPR